jgi:hypothetical protein
MSIADAAGGLFRWVGGAVVPMFLRPTAPAGLAWFVHLLLVAGAAVGLYFLQPHTPIQNLVGRGPNEFRPFWLPTLFLLVYALVWSAVWLWGLLAPNQPAPDYPDLDADWAAVLAALEKAGIGLADTPVFLVFGKPPGGYEPLFRALPNGLVVAGGTGPGASIQVYANREAVFLTVPGASLLGLETKSPAPADAGGEIGAGGSVAFDRSIGLGQSIAMAHSVGMGDGSIGASLGGSAAPLQEIQRIFKRARDENRPMTEAERARVQQLAGGGGGATGPAAGTSQGGGRTVLQDMYQVSEAKARLAHVCGLIASARWPLCPANGAVVTVPAGVADQTEAAQQWGLVARQDLEAAEAGLQLRFPVYALVTGLEDLRGGATFFEKLAAEKGSQRLGKEFPLNPDVRPEDVPAAVEASAGWVFGSLLPYLVYKPAHVEAAAVSGADTRENADLVRFLAELRKRGPNLARLVGRAVMPDPGRVPVFGGCYVSAVIRSDPTEARFTKAFLQKVLANQGAVAWTEAAYASEARYRSRTSLGYVLLAAWLAAVAALGAYVGYLKLGK